MTTEKSQFQTLGGIASALLAIATFAWGIYTYKETAAAQLEKDKADAKRTAETRRIEATKPFLDKQLTLYIQATRLAAFIAAHVSEPENYTKAKAEFHQLYWGEMCLVEQGEVEKAMVKFNTALDKLPDTELPKLALELAYACRKELAASWGTDAWTRHTQPDSDKQKP